MCSLEETEYQFWEKYLHLEEDDDISVDSYQVQRGSSLKQNRLNHRDMSLYGQRLDKDVFTVVTCNRCGMVLKQQALNDHLKKRHFVDSLSEEIYAFDETSFASSTTLDNFPALPIQPVAIDTMEYQPKTKKRKVNNKENIESHPLSSYPSRKPLQDEHVFLKPKPIIKPHAKAVKKEPENSRCQIKLKLRKSDHGMWTVATN